MADDVLDVADRLWEGEIPIEQAHPFAPRGGVAEVAEGCAFVPSFANLSAVATGDGLVLVDTGSQLFAPAAIGELRRKASHAVTQALSGDIRTRGYVFNVILQEKSIDDILLQHAFTLSPCVEATAPGVCTIQFTDDRNLAAKLARVIERLGKCEITAQAGIARLPDASFLAAHQARPVLQIDDAQEFLATLPIEMLAIEVN